jgi:hypothetical protein
MLSSRVLLAFNSFESPRRPQLVHDVPRLEAFHDKLNQGWLDWNYRLTNIA